MWVKDYAVSQKKEEECYVCCVPANINSEGETEPTFYSSTGRKILGIIHLATVCAGHLYNIHASKSLRGVQTE